MIAVGKLEGKNTSEKSGGNIGKETTEIKSREEAPTSREK